MKLTDYVGEQMLARRGVFNGWRVMVWALWALLTKPDRFQVEDTDEDIEMGMGGGQLRRLVGGVLMILSGIGRVFFSALGIALLLVILLLSPVCILMLRLNANLRAWRNLRRHAKQMAAARADLANRTPPH